MKRTSIRLFSLCAAFFLALCLYSCGSGGVDVIKAGSSSSYENTAQNELYEYDVFKYSVAVTKYLGSEENVSVPDKIEGKPVVQISSNAFYGCDDKIKTVFIPKTITSIEENAFTGNKIEEFKIEQGNPSYIEYDGAIMNIEKTELIAYACGSKDGSFSIPDKVRKIPSGVFSGSRTLKKINVPLSVKQIDTFALMGCGITELKLKGVEELGMGALWNCDKLTVLELPPCLKEISLPSSVCQSCTSLRIVKGYDSTDAKRLIEADGVNAEYVSLG